MCEHVTCDQTTRASTAGSAPRNCGGNRHRPGHPRPKHLFQHAAV